ncbi:hypothetical protein ACXYN8_09215 [Altererythrobacter sp. CAU 1778]
MADSTHSSDQIIRAAKGSLQVQQAGGRRSGSIGRGSAQLKRQHLKKKFGRIVLALAGIWMAASITGAVIDGLGFTGLMTAIFVTVAAVYLLGKYPRLKTPKRADLKTEDVRALVGKTELWLEHQRSALPAPIAKILTTIGAQLDELGLQLEEVDQQHPTARQIRKLVGEDLPEMIEGYRRIPQHLRHEERAGSTPARQLEEGLGHISREVDSITRQLAEGSLDELAIRTRYLDYKYGSAMGDAGDSGVPLPDFEAEKAARSKA